MNITDIRRKDIISFSTKYPEILGAKYNSVQVKDIVGHEIALLQANALGLDIPNIIQTIDAMEGTTTSIEDTTFLILKTKDGKQYVMATDWISNASLTAEENLASVKLMVHHVDETKINKLKELLPILGISEYSLEIL
jgi:hypothetical protein